MMDFLRVHVLQLLEKHKAMDSMVELLQLYEEEDQAYGGLLEASTQLYQYLLQPFRDMRELAMLRRQQIKVITVTVQQLQCHPLVPCESTHTSKDGPLIRRMAEFVTSDIQQGEMEEYDICLSNKYYLLDAIID